jgi:hypothetical protein
LADLRQALPGKQIFALSAVAGTGLKPLLEALWQQVKNAPESRPLVEERPYVPPVVVNKRSEEEMFKVVEGPADEGAWEPMDGLDEALEPIKEEDFIDAQGEKVAPMKGAKKKTAKSTRTTIAPVHSSPYKARRTAKERRTAHEAKVRLKKTVKDAKLVPPVPPAAPVAVDADLDAEIAAIKADDARKSKYYKRRKTDV